MQDYSKMKKIIQDYTKMTQVVLWDKIILIGEKDL